jgi:hypothetical protein
VWYIAGVTRGEAIDRINELLSSTDPATVNTSMRIPKPLREAAALAVSELSVAPSTTVMTANALRALLEATVGLANLELHYEEYPQFRPTLADLAVVAAEWAGSPLAERPDLLRRYAEELVQRHPDAEPEDVVLWAEAREYTSAEKKKKKDAGADQADRRGAA